MTPPEIGAQLDHLCLRSAKPQRLAAFFERGFGMTGTTCGRRWDVRGPQRELLIEAGESNRIAFMAFGFAAADTLAAYRRSLISRGVPLSANPSDRFDGTAFAVADPDGNRVVFGQRARAAEPDRRSPAPDSPLPARLQHVVVGSANIDAMVRFYELDLGFVVSDRVQDDAQVLRACFLRSDPEHHSLAIFRTATARLDHHSYETLDWEHIRRWADHLSRRDIAVVWGVGRHGPGNDVFFMVEDPDGNLVEISAELESCAPDRPSGIWPHGERTLNRWGAAMLRS